MRPRQFIMEILSWLLFVVFIAALLVVGALLLRGYLGVRLLGRYP